MFFRYDEHELGETIQVRYEYKGTTRIEAIPFCEETKCKIRLELTHGEDYKTFQKIELRFVTNECVEAMMRLTRIKSGNEEVVYEGRNPSYPTKEMHVIAFDITDVIYQMVDEQETVCDLLLSNELPEEANYQYGTVDANTFSSFVVYTHVRGKEDIGSNTIPVAFIEGISASLDVRRGKLTIGYHGVQSESKTFPSRMVFCFDSRLANHEMGIGWNHSETIAIRFLEEKSFEVSFVPYQRAQYVYLSAEESNRLFIDRMKHYPSQVYYDYASKTVAYVHPIQKNEFHFYTVDNVHTILSYDGIRGKVLARRSEKNGAYTKMTIQNGVVEKIENHRGEWWKLTYRDGNVEQITSEKNETLTCQYVTQTIENQSQTVLVEFVQKKADVEWERVTFTYTDFGEIATIKRQQIQCVYTYQDQKVVKIQRFVEENESHFIEIRYEDGYTVVKNERGEENRYFFDTLGRTQWIKDDHDQVQVLEPMPLEKNVCLAILSNAHLDMSKTHLFSQKHWKIEQSGTSIVRTTMDGANGNDGFLIEKNEINDVILSRKASFFKGGTWTLQGYAKTIGIREEEDVSLHLTFQIRTSEGKRTITESRTIAPSESYQLFTFSFDFESTLLEARISLRIFVKNQGYRLFLSDVRFDQGIAPRRFYWLQNSYVNETKADGSIEDWIIDAPLGSVEIHPTIEAKYAFLGPNYLIFKEGCLEQRKLTQRICFQGKKGDVLLFTFFAKMGQPIARIWQAVMRGKKGGSDAFSFTQRITYSKTWTPITMKIVCPNDMEELEVGIEAFGSTAFAVAAFTLQYGPQKPIIHYNEIQQPVTFENEHGGCQSVEYDTLGKAICFVNEQGDILQTAFDESGNPVYQMDQKGNIVYRTFDTRGNQLSQRWTSSMNAFLEQSQSINAYDCKQSETNDVGEETIYRYAKPYQVSSVQNAKGQNVYFYYDAKERLTQKTVMVDGRLLSLNYQYVEDRIQSVSIDQQTVYRFIEDDQNRVQQVNLKNACIAAFAYEKTIQGISQEVVTKRTEYNADVSYLYDDQLKLQAETFQGQTIQHFTYDAGQRVRSVMDEKTGESIVYTYDDQQRYFEQKADHWRKKSFLNCFEECKKEILFSETMRINQDYVLTGENKAQKTRFSFLASLPERTFDDAVLCHDQANGLYGMKADITSRFSVLQQQRSLYLTNADSHLRYDLSSTNQLRTTGSRNGQPFLYTQWNMAFQKRKSITLMLQFDHANFGNQSLLTLLNENEMNGLEVKILPTGKVACYENGILKCSSVTMMKQNQWNMLHCVFDQERVGEVYLNEERMYFTFSTTNLVMGIKTLRVGNDPLHPTAMQNPFQIAYLSMGNGALWSDEIETLAKETEEWMSVVPEKQTLATLFRYEAQDTSEEATYFEQTVVTSTGRIPEVEPYVETAMRYTYEADQNRYGLRVNGEQDPLIYDFEEEGKGSLLFHFSQQLDNEDRCILCVHREHQSIFLLYRSQGCLAYQTLTRSGFVLTSRGRVRYTMPVEVTLRISWNEEGTCIVQANDELMLPLTLPNLKGAKLAFASEKQIAASSVTYPLVGALYAVLYSKETYTSATLSSLKEKTIDVKSEYQFDSLGRVMTTIQHTSKKQIKRNYGYERGKKGADQTSGRLVAEYFEDDSYYAYLYDLAGNIIKDVQYGPSDEEGYIPVYLEYQYQYDTLQRLIEAKELAPNVATYSYTYDAYGNVLSMKKVQGNDVYEKVFTYHPRNLNCLIGITRKKNDVVQDTTTYQYPITCYQYPIKITTTRRVPISLAWERTHLVQYGSMQYDYDRQGRRIRARNTKTLATEEIVYVENKIHQVIKRVGNQTYAFTFLYDAYQKRIGFRYVEHTYLYKMNGFGRIDKIIDENGNEIVEYRYDPWGVTTYAYAVSWSAVASILLEHQPFRFMNYYYDEAMQCYYLETRYYDPSIGRFLSSDSIDYLDINSFHGLNLFAYCNNNPVMFMDPRGTSSVLATLLIIGLALCSPQGGTALQIGVSALSYLVMSVWALVDLAGNQGKGAWDDMCRVYWNPFNEDGMKVEDSNQVSFYKGVPVFRISGMGGSMSLGAIFFDKSHGVKELKHERGHSTQMMAMGIINYLVQIGIPSVWKNGGETPWELSASMLGGSTSADDKSKNQKQQANGYFIRTLIPIVNLYNIFAYIIY